MWGKFRVLGIKVLVLGTDHLPLEVESGPLEIPPDTFVVSQYTRCLKKIYMIELIRNPGIFMYYTSRKKPKKKISKVPLRLQYEIFRYYENLPEENNMMNIARVAKITCGTEDNVWNRRSEVV